MVVHEHVGMNSGSEPFAQFGKQSQEMKSVGVVPEDFLALVTASSDVIPTTRNFDTQRARQWEQVKQLRPPLSNHKCPMWIPLKKLPPDTSDMAPGEY